MLARSSLRSLITCLSLTAFMVSGCGGQSNPAQEDNVKTDKELVIKATNFKFDKSEYRVKSGEPIRIVLDAVGNHGVAIKELHLSLDPTHPQQVITPEQPGTYDLSCTILCGPGHNEMTAKFIVEK
ncbi:cytochrome C oxidase subunit II [Paenibacillus alvei]|uniref:Cytochrome C oxidase subunit II n=1 Tax=Paenibacillus alvei TaxID=44250 RepID=A0AAP6ZZV9_PAEAL|nr:cytochrome C oxidase subunit II [Paenibacillus alvei]MBG9737248.1 cytochrome c oxidase subunit II [Paenibacillus alvei]MBG9746342.1 cytochrome c oxidase subunit II [Paenibacillus alvei]MCY9581698.1 cytochrome C oxidase subunit II [Paenibacillus alvei]MCY9586175.1 cytochrome C oxidase subunit II [Paenibacillus alvei]NEZ42536.1 cytochrome C oxidase subunit II [Paenibacillus alvei]